MIEVIADKNCWKNDILENDIKNEMKTKMIARSYKMKLLL